MPLDLNEIRKTWTARYGEPLARRMLAGASGLAYDSARGLARDQLGPLLGAVAGGVGAVAGTAANAIMSGPGPATTDQRRRTKMATQYRRARDQSPDDTDEGLNQIKTFLRNRLDPADFDRLEQMLAALNGGEREPDDSGSMHAGGQDEPEPFRGRPQAGGRVRWDEDGEPDLLPTRSSNIPEENRREIRNNYAQDSRGGGYFAMFPSNAKVVTSNYGG
jgi:hypothetical protein